MGTRYHFKVELNCSAHEMVILSRLLMLVIDNVVYFFRFDTLKTHLNNRSFACAFNLHIKRLSLALLLLFVAACANTQKLTEKPPANVNLSGDWVLDKDASDTVVLAPLRQANAKKGRSKGKGRGKGERDGSRPRRGEADQASGKVRTESRLASMVTTQMKIEQDVHGIGVAYPKHRYRDIDWGEVETRRSTVISGWRSDGSLVVKSKSDHRSLTEVYQLNHEGNILTVTFLVDRQGGEDEFTRVFNLSPATRIQ